MKTPPRNGKRAAKVAVHAHERKLHPGKPLTKLPKPTVKRKP
jgi:hypothetical protein